MALLLKEVSSCLRFFFLHLCLGYCGKLSSILSILQESWQSCPDVFEVSCEVLLLGSLCMLFPYCCVWAYLLLHQTDTKSAHTGTHILQTHSYTHTRMFACTHTNRGKILVTTHLTPSLKCSQSFCCSCASPVHDWTICDVLS